MRGYNSSIRVKEKICVSCGKPCFWFSKKRCQQCARVEDAMAKDEKEVMEEDGMPELISDLDALVSRYVRLSAKGKDGLINCYTCSFRGAYGEMDAGHYIGRSCMYLRFDFERNIRPQCHICNRSKYGMAAAFGKKLDIELPNLTEVLLEESRIIHHWSRSELKQMIGDFSNKINSLK